MSSTTDTMQAMIDNLPDNTGRNLAQWLKVVAKSGLDRHGGVHVRRREKAPRTK